MKLKIMEKYKEFVDKHEKLLLGAMAFIMLSYIVPSDKDNASTKTNENNDDISDSIVNEYQETEIIEENMEVLEYKVEDGDCLSVIADKLYVDEDLIAKINNIEDENKIQVDDTLLIPVTSEVKKEVLNLKKNIENEKSETQQIEQMQGLVKGIDISSHNVVDWNLLEEQYKAGKFSYVILRMAENWNKEQQMRMFTLDSSFERNLSECNKRNIPYGVYVFSRAENKDEIYAETNAINNYISNHLNKTKVVNGEELDLRFNLSLPFYMDCFEPDAKGQYELYTTGQYDKCVELIDLWCGAMEDAGYFTGVYCQANQAKNIGFDRLSAYTLWLAHYGNRQYGDISDIKLNNKVVLDGIIRSQQVTDSATLNGIKGNVDVNITDGNLINLVRDFYSREKRKCLVHSRKSNF